MRHGRSTSGTDFELIIELSRFESNFFAHVSTEVVGIPLYHPNGKSTLKKAVCDVCQNADSFSESILLRIMLLLFREIAVWNDFSISPDYVSFLYIFSPTF